MQSISQDVRAAEDNYFSAWRLLAGAAPRGVVDETDDIIYASVGAPLSYFNNAFIKPHADPEACIHRVKDFFLARELPFSLRFRSDDDLQPDAPLEAAGLVPAGATPLMVADVVDITASLTHDVRRVDEGSWSDHVATVADGFGMQLELVEALIPPSLATDSSYAAFNAYVDGRVASTSALVVSGATAGVYNVATPQAYRNRGLGEATTRAAVVEGARRGCTRTTLQASEMGRPLYEQMGYRTIATWRNFTGP